MASVACVILLEPNYLLLSLGFIGFRTNELWSAP
jgi:hypothetical protein